MVNSCGRTELRFKDREAAIGKPSERQITLEGQQLSAWVS